MAAVDVHAVSETMAAVARQDYADLGPATARLAAGPEGGATLAYVRQAMPPHVHPVLDKLASRIALTDPHLCDTNPVGLLVLVWAAVKATGGTSGPEAEALAALRCTLEDMGSTCLQGDTHRLFALLVALHRSHYSI